MSSLSSLGNISEMSPPSLEYRDVGNISDLPKEIIKNILFVLSLQEMGNASAVCKEWQKTIQINIDLKIAKRIYQLIIGVQANFLLGGVKLPVYFVSHFYCSGCFRDNDIVLNSPKDKNRKCLITPQPTQQPLSFVLLLLQQGDSRIKEAAKNTLIRINRQESESIPPKHDLSPDIDWETVFFTIEERKNSQGVFEKPIVDISFQFRQSLSPLQILSLQKAHEAAQAFLVP